MDGWMDRWTDFPNLSELHPGKVVQHLGSQRGLHGMWESPGPKSKNHGKTKGFSTLCAPRVICFELSVSCQYMYIIMYIYIFIFLHMNYLKKTKCTYINESSVAQDFLKLWRWELPKGDIEGVPWRAANRERGSNWDDYPSKMKHCNLKKTASAIDIFVCLKLGDTLFTWPFNGANGDKKNIERTVFVTMWGPQDS